MTGLAPDPSDRTRRFLRNLGADETAVAAEAPQTVIELNAEYLDPPTEVSLAMTATLLVRLADFAPTIRIVAPRDRTVALPRLPDTPVPEALATAHTGFASVGRITTAPGGRCDLRLVFNGQAGGIPVDSAGWAVAIGHRLDGAGNGLAAAYTGVLAAAEAFKTVIGPVPVRVKPWRGVASLWDYSMTAAIGPGIPELHIGEHTWVGAGGVASATAWTLAALHHVGTRLSGYGSVLDDDMIDEDGTNLNRHLIALMTDLKAGKADLLAGLLTGCGLDLTPQPCRWEKIAQAEHHPSLAVISVDDDAVRRAIQYDMPKTIVNAGTGDQGEYQASTHNFLDGACLACISRADKAVSGPEASLARRLGLPQEALKPLLDSASPLPGHILAAARLTDQERAEIAQIPGRRLLQRFCDDLLLADNGPAVSAPMLSAAAGVLLAVEIAKNGLPGLSSAPGRVLRTSILTGPHGRWCSQRGKTAECHCTEAVYQQHYRSLWRA
jgi:hypothetical protein